MMKKLLLFISVFLSGLIYAQQPDYPSRITVATDGSGDYKTIQAAINAVRAYSPVSISIFIKNGIYNEKLVIPAWVTNITITGESREHTIISNADYSGKFIASGTDT